MSKLFFISLALGLTGCSSRVISPIAASVQDELLTVTFSKEDARFIVRNGYVVYLYTGRCDGSGSRSGGGASYKEDKLPNQSLVAAIDREKGDVSFHVEVGPDTVADCAIISINSMIPFGYKVHPKVIPLARP